MIEYYSALVAWIRATGAADFAGFIDLPISIVGLGATIIAAIKARNAAAAAKEARDAIQLFETIVDFSAAIATLEEIKRLHRQGGWAILPDRYAAIRKLLIQLRNSTTVLSDTQSTAIQDALVNLRNIEKQVERGLADPSLLNPAKLNSIISRDVDELQAVFLQLKSKNTGDA